ncbi:MAG TPA: DUF3592 domain-containing protein [Terriglobales bacterium]|nr:DUF3592 domain-containing protein [Terriglobales bacterium]
MFETDIDGTAEHTGSLFYLSVPCFWLRELWLAHAARQWQVIEATIESSHRSLGGSRETIRLEVWYSYHFQGQYYSGRLVRDSCFSYGSVNRAIARYKGGTRAYIHVDPHNPARSYLPSGMGWLEPLLMVFVSFGSVALIVAIVLAGILSAVGSKFK